MSLFLAYHNDTHISIWWLKFSHQPTHLYSFQFERRVEERPQILSSFTDFFKREQGKLNSLPCVVSLISTLISYLVNINLLNFKHNWVYIFDHCIRETLICHLPYYFHCYIMGFFIYIYIYIYIYKYIYIY